MAPGVIVRKAEVAYTEQNIDRKMALFDPETVIYWNGRKVAEGLEEVRQFHEDGAEPVELKVQKTSAQSVGLRSLSTGRPPGSIPMEPPKTVPHPG